MLLFSISLGTVNFSSLEIWKLDIALQVVSLPFCACCHSMPWPGWSIIKFLRSSPLAPATLPSDPPFPLFGACLKKKGKVFGMHYTVPNTVTVWPWPILALGSTAAVMHRTSGHPDRLVREEEFSFPLARSAIDWIWKDGIRRTDRIGSGGTSFQGRRPSYSLTKG
jgi:hypothetical protein